MNVLIVDDSPLETSIHKTLLGRIATCSLTSFTDPVEALDWTKSNEVDILVVDYLMPEMNGLEFLKSFREIEGKSEIPALVVTASTEREVRYKALNLGANDFLNKPIDVPEYRARIKNMFALREHQKDLASRTEWLAAEVRKATMTLSTLVEHLPEGIILLDGKGRIILTNSNGERYLELLEHDREGDVLSRIAGRSIREYLLTQSQTRWHDITSGNPPSRYFRIAAELVGQRDDPTGIALVIIDVTDETIRLQRAQFQERLAALGQLATGISHDFNNILTVISASTQLSMTDKGISKSTEGKLSSILNQVDRASGLIRQILDFSRASSSEKIAMDLVPFIKEMSKLFRRTFPQGIEISIHYQPGMTYRVHADPVRLDQILTNLAVNARDAMPSGGKLEIELSQFVLRERVQPPFPGMASGTWVTLSVSDTGRGIKPEILPRIYDPYFTTKDRDKGTGLGLSQVYGLVKEHHGFIGVESSVGKGTTFAIYLPVPDGKGQSSVLPSDNGTLESFREGPARIPPVSVPRTKRPDNGAKQRGGGSA